jgi:hypothetical protein
MAWSSSIFWDKRIQIDVAAKLCLLGLVAPIIACLLNVTHFQTILFEAFIDEKCDNVAAVVTQCDCFYFHQRCVFTFWVTIFDIERKTPIGAFDYLNPAVYICKLRSGFCTFSLKICFFSINNLSIP